jgi:type IV secretory pathway VirB10-like protein
MEQVIKDKASKPAGLVPKNLQAFFIVGLALLMVLVMAITGHRRPTPIDTAGALPALPNPVPVNSQRVTDFQNDIEQAQRESAPQVVAALLQQQRKLASPSSRVAQPLATNPYGTPVTSADPGGAYPPGAYAASLPEAAENQPSPDPVREEQKKRAYFSLFSDNLALTYRKEVRGVAQALALSPGENRLPPRFPVQSDAFPASVSVPARGEMPAEAQMLLPTQAAGLVAQRPIPLAAETAPDAALPPDSAAPSQSEKTMSAGVIPKPALPSPGGKQYLLFEGTVLEALLINRLDGTFAGPVSCLVSNHVYSHDRQHLLIPEGSKIVGEASKVDTFGQTRLAVAFHRLIMPDGYSITLDRFKGIDQEGATALKNKVNHHYAGVFGASIAIGILGGAAQLGTGSTLDSRSSDRLREGFGVGMANSGEHILDRFLNIFPTVTIREGTRVKIYLSNDLLLPDYNSHTAPANL